MQDKMQNITLKTVGGWANLAFCFWLIVISANCISLSPLAFGRRSGRAALLSPQTDEHAGVLRPSLAAAANVIARRETPRSWHHQRFEAF